MHCEGRTFVAGGHISGFDDTDFSAARFNAALARLEGLDRPVAAVLHGTTLGGGLELALACHYRVCVPGAQFGFPEVKLGILPGSLGTQRLPRLVGPGLALDLIASGRSITAEAALAAGIVDAVREGQPLAVGLVYVQELLARQAAPRRLSERSVPTASVAPAFFEQALDEAKRREAFYTAAGAIVEAVRAAVELPFAEGEAVEARLFEQLRLSPQSKALRHLFFAERQAARIPGLPRELALRPVRSVGCSAPAPWAPASP